jgi:hypothetical protein
MRQIFPAILLLLVFFSFQFGKISTYLFCKWQAEAVQNPGDCGCDDHLISMFDNNGTDAKSSHVKIALNEKLNEFSPQSFFEIYQPVNLSVQGFAGYKAALSERFIAAPFHPPAA